MHTSLLTLAFFGIGVFIGRAEEPVRLFSPSSTPTLPALQLELRTGGQSFSPSPDPLPPMATLNWTDNAPSSQVIVTTGSITLNRPSDVINWQRPGLALTAPFTMMMAIPEAIDSYMWSQPPARELSQVEMIVPPLYFAPVTR